MPHDSKAGDWRSYDRVLLPAVDDLHKLEVYEEAEHGYGRLRTALEADALDSDNTIHLLKH